MSRATIRPRLAATLPDVYQKPLNLIQLVQIVFLETYGNQYKLARHRRP